MTLKQVILIVYIDSSYPEVFLLL